MINETEILAESLKFPVGARVKVTSSVVDFNFFRSETGIVKRNNGKYLGIIVEFDLPRLFENGTIQKTFNFNPRDLELLQDSPVGHWYYGFGEDEVPQEFDEKPNGYIGPFATWQLAVSDLLERERLSHQATIKELKQLKKQIKQLVKDVNLSSL